MDATVNDRELAETLIALAGASAREAASLFAGDCRNRGDHGEAALWERVVGIIETCMRGGAHATAPVRYGT